MPHPIPTTSAKKSLKMAYKQWTLWCGCPVQIMRITRSALTVEDYSLRKYFVPPVGPRTLRLEIQFSALVAMLGQ